MPKSNTKTLPSGSFIDEIERTLFDKREIHIVGGIDQNQSYTYVKILRFLAHRSDKPIRIFLNTPGGSVLDGLSMYDQTHLIARHVPIDIIAAGSCMSMGVILLQAGTTRAALPNTRFLLHELQNRTGGSLSAMRDDMQETERLQVVLDEILADRTGQDMTKLRKLFERRDYFLDTKAALKYNLIDRIVTKD